MTDPMHPEEMLRRMTKADLEEVALTQPSTDVVYALAEALMREDPKAKELMEGLIAARAGLMLYLRNRRSYKPPEMGSILGWCTAMSNHYCWDGRGEQEGGNG